jgi:hypothetical protein
VIVELEQPDETLELIQRIGFLTGSRAFHNGAGNDYDYVVCFDDLYANRANYDMARITNGVKDYIKESDDGAGFGVCKLTIGDSQIDVIVVNRTEFMVWKAATESYKALVSVLHLRRCDKGRRVFIFEGLKKVIRESMKKSSTEIHRRKHEVVQQTAPG